MSNLSVGAVLRRLRAIKTLLHDGQTTGADTCISDIIKNLSNSQCICSRCGYQISINEGYIAGSYCETCCSHIQNKETKQ